MKIKMFNKGQGWYVSATNYKNKQDKAYMNLHFSSNHCQEPVYEDNGRGFSVQDIDIQEAIFSAYKGKIGLTIFKYELLTNVSLDKKESAYNSNFGGEVANSYQSLDIQPNDLPFY